MEETVTRETMPITEVKRIYGESEEQGFDAPFATYTWKHWIDIKPPS